MQVGGSGGVSSVGGFSLLVSRVAVRVQCLKSISGRVWSVCSYWAGRAVRSLSRQGSRCNDPVKVRGSFSSVRCLVRAVKVSSVRSVLVSCSRFRRSSRFCCQALTVGGASAVACFALNVPEDRGAGGGVRCPGSKPPPVLIREAQPASKRKSVSERNTFPFADRK